MSTRRRGGRGSLSRLVAPVPILVVAAPARLLGQVNPQALACDERDPVADQLAPAVAVGEKVIARRDELATGRDPERQIARDKIPTGSTVLTGRPGPTRIMTMPNSAIGRPHSGILPPGGPYS